MTPEEGPPDKWLWETPDAFLGWFEKQRPKAFRRYRDFMKKKHRTAEKPELLRLGTARPRERARRSRSACATSRAGCSAT